MLYPQAERTKPKVLLPVRLKWGLSHWWQVTFGNEVLVKAIQHQNRMFCASRKSVKRFREGGNDVEWNLFLITSCMTTDIAEGLKFQI